MSVLSFLIFVGSLLLTQGSKNVEMYGGSVPKPCQSVKPVQSNYKPEGREWTLTKSSVADMKIYETANRETRKVVIVAYDIFGFHPNTKQVSDILAKTGDFKIAMPDYYRGSPFNLATFPPKDMNEVYKFIQERGSWETAKKDTMAVIDYYKTAENVTSFGIIGFCWGGKVAEMAAIELKDMKVAALVHPVLINLEEAAQVAVPTYLLSSVDEPDMTPFYEVLKSKFGPSNCGHKKYELMHGFSSARGNFSDPANNRAVNDVIGILTTFFTGRL